MIKVQRRCMSQIGKRVLKYSNQVAISTSPYSPTPSFPRAVTQIDVTGPMGKLSMPIEQFITVNFPEPPQDFPKLLCQLTVTDPYDKVQKAMWGTTAALLKNMVQGVAEGFTVPLRLNGVGYRAQLENETQLHLKLGYSHPIILDIPEGVQVSIPAPQRIILQGIDFPRITQFAATIRKYRPPEPYNQKGVFVGEETIKKKEGKKR